jgi:hypothetical protein
VTQGMMIVVQAPVIQSSLNFKELFYTELFLA